MDYSTILGAAVVLAQTSGPPAAAPTSPIQVQSVLDFVMRGGPTMIAIGVCSLIALTVIVERLIILRRGSIIPPAFMAGLNNVASDRTRALDFCRANKSPAANIMAAAIKRRGESRDSVEKGVEEAGHRELVRLRHRMRLLGALPQVSTMLGLLGTIFGMIKTFQAVATSAQALGKTELLAKGIFEAWTNTAAGLLVAIPVLIAYHVLMGRIDMLVVELDRVAVDFVEEEHERRTSASAIPARSTEMPKESVMPMVAATIEPAIA